MTNPKLACPNLFSDVGMLKSFAMDHGFQGVDWTLRPEDLPKNPLEEARLTTALTRLAPLAVRYHLFFPDTEPGDMDPFKAVLAMKTLCYALELISRLMGRFVTIHLGVGRDCTEGISWERTIAGLANLATKARGLGIRVCLENLAWGWTGRPELLRKTPQKDRLLGHLGCGSRSGMQLCGKRGIQGRGLCPAAPYAYSQRGYLSRRDVWKPHPSHLQRGS